ncbi:MAG: endopeptidase La, partial [Pelolinea sp.]|nr:endopeptidase La [Pelolinea sp.]
EIVSVAANPIEELIVEISNKDQALINLTKSLFENILQLDRSIPEEAHILINSISSPGWLADMVCTAIGFSFTERVEIFEIYDPIQRLSFVKNLALNKLEILQIEEELRSSVQREVDKSQRDFYLRERVKAINVELGEGDIWEEEINKYARRVQEEELPKEVKEVLEGQIRRLSSGNSLSPETSIVRNYIEWLLSVPWFKKSIDNLDMQQIEKILEKNHFGLSKAKDRLLEYIAVESLRSENTKQPILCFIGPPGTGKTSFGLSIAKAIKREFVRISLGGIKDEAEIRGHRRTYIGALPGRIIQTMKRAGTLNPLFMLDEIDKMGYDYRGDPAAALLEILDKEQNNSFSDHYLELPYDLSNVFFITTANTTDNIPPALLDRMEIIEFPGYILEEKVEIAQRHLIEKQILENSLSYEDIEFPQPIILDIIQNYTYESGVRDLERQIGKICRKISKLKLENSKKIGKKLTSAGVEKYLGPPQYFPFMAEENDEIGVAYAVAWTENGGEIMPVEVSVFEGKGNLNVTGQVGDVMQESAQTALTFIKSRAKEFNIKMETFEKMDIHIHIPEGAVPKDGPSGGITLCLAMISALTKRKTFHDVGLTGEITLRGKVLPVGGLREKILAAHRAGLKKIIIPGKNKKDLVEISSKIKKVLEIIPLDHMDDIIKVALMDH